VIDAGKQAVVEQAVLVLVFEAEAGALASSSPLIAVTRESEAACA
jgi:hypothetical protein